MNIVRTLALWTCALWACAWSAPVEKEVNKVAQYIVALHEASTHPTIFTLLGVSKKAPESVLNQARAKLLKECYNMKKSPSKNFKSGTTTNMARMLVVGGHEILTDKKLREAYEWILNEAPPEFMRMFFERTKKPAKPVFFMPSALSFVLVLLGSFWLFDIVSTLSSFHKPAVDTKLKMKQKQKRKAAPTETLRRKTFADTYTYKAVSGLVSVFRRASTRIRIEEPKKHE
ncbi:hypothetical protein NECID01_1747 [Nematocida sp. AWRm77]|nr:hypothetical protein NECID01_1747 [Nematocida sp. AWRm77]